jgi:hypothetical protein
MRICTGQPPRRTSRVDERRDHSINNTGAGHRHLEYPATIARNSKNNALSLLLWRFLSRLGPG